MNATAFDAALAATLRDVGGATWTPTDRQTATRKAVMRYSQYRPALRRYGTGAVWTAVGSGGNTIDVVGGTWFNGDTILIDPLQAPEAPLTVEGVTAVSADPTTTSPVLQLTISGNLANAHGVNALVTHQPPAGYVTPGLLIVPGTDTYLLPGDFVRPEQESFDLAVGAKASVRRGNGFYDAAYDISNALSGTGWGSSSNFAGTYQAGGASNQQYFAALPGGTAIAGSQSSSETVYRFLTNMPKMLVITPIPQTAMLLDYYYRGMHTTDSAPEEDSDAILAQATAEALLMQAVPYALDGEMKTTDLDTRSSKSVQGFTALAQRYADTFNRRIVRVFYSVSG